MPTPTNAVKVNGYAIGALRTAVGDTRAHVAAISGIGVNYQSLIESGRRCTLSPAKFAGLARWAASHGIDRRALMAYPPPQVLAETA